MPGQCRVCLHPKRDDIDKALVQRISMRDIAGIYGSSKSAIDRHKQNCLAQTLAAAPEQQQVQAKSRPVAILAQPADLRSADDLVSLLQRLIGEALAILDDSKGAGDRRTALQALKACAETAQQVGKASGWINEGPTTNIDARSVNVFSGLDTAELRTLLAALPAPQP